MTYNLIDSDLVADNNNKDLFLNFKAPKDVQITAHLALLRASKYKKAGTSKSNEFAKKLADGASLSLSEVKLISRFFPRHNKPAEERLPEEQLLWDLWGGDKAKVWADDIAEKAEQAKQQTYSFSDGEYSPYLTFKHNQIRVPMAKIGAWKHETYGVVRFSFDDFKQIIKNFLENHTGYTPSLYYGHPIMDPKFVSGEARKAILERLVIEEEELVGYFNPLQESLIEALGRGEYSSASVDLRPRAVSKKTGKQIGMLLTGCALTNTPFIPDMGPVQVMQQKEMAMAFSDSITCPEDAMHLSMKLTIEPRTDVTMSKSIYERLQDFVTELRLSSEKSSEVSAKTGVDLVEVEPVVELAGVATQAVLEEKPVEVIQVVETVVEPVEVVAEPEPVIAPVVEVEPSEECVNMPMETNPTLDLLAANLNIASLKFEIASLQARLAEEEKEKSAAISMADSQIKALTERFEAFSASQQALVEKTAATEVALSEANTQVQSLSQSLHTVALADVQAELVADGIFPHVADKYVSQLFQELSLADSSENIKAIARKLFSTIPPEQRSEPGVQYGSVALTEGSIPDQQEFNPFEGIIARLQSSSLIKSIK